MRGKNYDELLALDGGKNLDVIVDILHPNGPVVFKDMRCDLDDFLANTRDRRHGAEITDERLDEISRTGIIRDYDPEIAKRLAACNKRLTTNATLK